MKVRVLVAVAATVLVSGCGSAQPGAAAVVGDTTISMSRADDTAEVYCRLAVLSSPPGTPVSNADVRRQAVTDLVFGVVARDIAAEENIVPRPSAYKLTSSQREEIEGTFPAGESDDVIDAIVGSQRTIAIAERLGAKELGRRGSNPEQVRDAGFQQIEAEVARRDVRFDPRFGIGRDGKQKALTGSLSVPVEAPEATDEKELPAAQRCSG